MISPISPAQLWAAIGAVALLGFSLKAVGPAVIGERDLSPRVRAVLALTAPALLAGFLLVDLAGPGWSVLDPTLLGGIAAGVALRLLRRASLPVVMAGAVAATALLRLLF